MNDLISRQAAIDAANRADYRGLAVEDVKKVTDEVVKELKHLPTAQQEIIRCKDCKHWKFDHTCHEHSLVSPMMANDFCSRAERRTDG